MERSLAQPQLATRHHQPELNAIFKRAGVDVLSLSTEADLIHAIASFVMLRRQRRR